MVNKLLHDFMFAAIYRDFSNICINIINFIPKSTDYCNPTQIIHKLTLNNIDVKKKTA